MSTERVTLAGKNPVIQMQPGQKIYGAAPVGFRVTGGTSGTKTTASMTASGTYVEPAPIPVPTPTPGIPTIQPAPAPWIEVMHQRFLTDVPEGGFTNNGHPAYPLLNPYDYGWTSGGGGMYDPGIVSVKDGKLRIRLHTDSAGKHHIFAMTSFPPGCSTRGGYDSLRVSTVLRADRMPGFKMVGSMGWPDLTSKEILWNGQDLGPDYVKWFGGEIDVAEVDFNGGKMSSFLHYPDVAIKVDPVTKRITPLEEYQRWFDLGVTHEAWHLVDWELVDGQWFMVAIDGVEKGRDTDPAHVPHVSFHANWQFETNLARTAIDPTVSGYVEIAEIRQYRR